MTLSKGLPEIKHPAAQTILHAGRRIELLNLVT
jgi:hypothetical protein